MDIFGIFSAFGLSASAGLNAYIPLLVVALLARFTDLLQLKEPWDALASWWLIGLLVVLSLIQSFVRPAAGAVVFAANAKILTDISPVLSLACGLFIAGGVHAVKSVAIRPAVTATTAGAGNIPVSVLEDVISTIVSILSIIVPVLMVVILIVVIAWWVSRRRYRRKYLN
jgi:hypothetical protein